MTALLLAEGPAAGIVFGLFLLFVVIAAIVILAKIVVVGSPNEMLIISGGRYREGLGYRVIIGGRAFEDDCHIRLRVVRRRARTPQAHFFLHGAAPD